MAKVIKNSGIMGQSFYKLAQDYNRLLAMYEAKEKIAEIKIETAIQCAFDACTLAANDVFKMGPGRAPAFIEAASHYMEEMNKAAAEEANIGVDYKGNQIVQGDTDIPATFDLIDRRMKLIFWPKDFTPYQERYSHEEHQKIIEAEKEKLRKVGVDV